MKKSLCNQTEFLMFVGPENQGDVEGGYHLMTMSDALAAADDNTTSIIRMDAATWQGENITEEVAAAWLAENPTDIDDIRLTPDYVANSDAWENYCEDYRTAANDHHEMQLQGVA